MCVKALNDIHFESEGVNRFTIPIKHMLFFPFYLQLFITLSYFNS